jgi:hypothetical protein
MRKIIDKFYRAFFARAGAFAASYTAFFARTHNFFAFARARTPYIHGCARGYAIDDSLGTLGYTSPARTTLVAVYRTYSAHYAYGVIRTSPAARAEPQASVRTSLVAAREKFFALARIVAFVSEFRITVVAAHTMNDRDGRFAFLNFHAENTRDFTLVFYARGVAFVYLRFALDERFGERFATRVTATAAVCARETLGYFVNSLVSLDREKFTQKREQESQNAGYTRNYKRW